MCSLLISTFFIIFSPSASPFTFYLCRVLKVHNWAFDFIRFFDPTLLSVSLSSNSTWDWLCFFFPTKSPEKMRKRKLYIPSNKHGRAFSRKSLLVSHSVSKRRWLNLSW
jgi:hypothetical protein